MNPTVYLETTVVSYLAAHPSRVLIVAAHQETTRLWWDRRRRDFDLFVSQVVVDEAGVGDPDAVARRLAILGGIPLLDLTPTVANLAVQLATQLPLPEKARADALHIAAASAHGMNYLLTWNCTHIANATRREAIETIIDAQGLKAPIICTPDELLEESNP